MAVDIHKLIATIIPDVYCSNVKKKPEDKESPRDKVKKLSKEGRYLEAAEFAEPIEAQPMDFDAVKYDPGKLEGFANPIEKHRLIYDVSGQLLEQIYFWLLDNIPEDYKDIIPVEKIADNFVASPGSSYFGEWTARAAQMQQQAMQMLGTVNTVIKSILNLVYDLREFKLRLDPYDKLNSKNKDEKEAARLSLKQIWLDTVDAKRGTTSVKGLALSGQGQPGFVTLIDGFMAVDNVEQAEKIDLNDVVKRILKQRIQEFNKWIVESELDLRKRYKLEQNYVKSQMSTLKLYANWIRPYLEAASRVEQRAPYSAELVNAFNTVVFELAVLGGDKAKVAVEVARGNIPEFLKRAPIRHQFYFVIIVELKFRSVPEKVGQHHRYTGKAELYFTSYALTDVEIRTLKEQLDKDNTKDAMKLIQEATAENISDIEKEVREIVESKLPEKEEEKKSGDTNPFSALFSIFRSDKKKDKKGIIEPDNEYEKMMRNAAILMSRTMCQKFYDKFKKANAMPA